MKNTGIKEAIKDNLQCIFINHPINVIDFLLDNKDKTLLELYDHTSEWVDSIVAHTEN